MSKFCGNCGKPVTEDQAFCPHCGSPLHPASSDSTIQAEDARKNAVPRQSAAPSAREGQAAPGQPMKGKHLSKELAAALAVVLIIACGAGAYYVFRPEEPKPAAAAAQTQTAAVPAEPAEKTPVPEDPLKVVQQEFSRRQIAGTVIATSYGHNPNGCLVVLGGKGMRMAAWDIQNGRVAFISSPSSHLRSFMDNKTAPHPLPVIFNMTIDGDTHDQDEAAGYWSGSSHTIPVYALYTLDDSGNVIPGVLHTAAGQNPSHYQGYLYEQKNVVMANLVLTEMAALQENAAAHNVRL